MTYQDFRWGRSWNLVHKTPNSFATKTRTAFQSNSPRFDLTLNDRYGAEAVVRSVPIGTQDTGFGSNALLTEAFGRRWYFGLVGHQSD